MGKHRTKANAAASPLSPILCAALLACGTLLAYANCFSVPLILDDWVTILHNPTIRQFAPRTLFAPSENTGLGGRPVAHASFVLNYALTGDSLRGYHAVNLALHLAAGLTLFGIVRRTLRRPGVSDTLAPHADGIALAAAALWLWHPIQTQTVTYVSQRTEALMGLFYFLTLYAFVRSAESTRRVALAWQVAAVASCFAGVGSKEGMVTAPLMVLLFDAAFVTRSLGETLRRRWGFYVALASAWLALGALMHGLKGRGVGFDAGMAWWTYLLIECRAIALYAWLAAWPARLVFDYGTDLGTTGAVEAACALGLAGAAAWIAFNLRRRPAAAFLGAWCLITLSPTSSVVPIPLQPISENRVYVPLAAGTVGVALLVFRRWPEHARRAAGLASVAFAVLTFARNADYQSGVSIWADTVAKRPESSRAHANLGQALEVAGRLPEAKAELEAALRLRPGYADAHANLAAVVGKQGDIDGAIAHGRLATQAEPKNAQAHYNLGVALTQKGQLAEAVPIYEAMLRLQPHAVAGRANLALLLLRVNRPADAVGHAQKVLELDPNFADARFALGCGLAMLGRFADAVPHLEEAVRLRPNHVEAIVNLAVSLLNAGRRDEAIARLESALRLDPNAAHARAWLEQARAMPAGGR